MVARLPPSFKTYYEPFLGGGAVLLALEPERARASDLNAELMNVFAVVKDPWLLKGLVHRLRELGPADEQTYYKVRAARPRSLEAQAARTIYLNKTTFNGLYRVNARGEFNAPYGHCDGRGVFDEAALWATHEALRGTTLRCERWQNALARAKRGDAVYLDPPYDGAYGGYTVVGFGEADQRALVDATVELGKRGVAVVLSSSDTPLMRELCCGRRELLVERLSARRSVSPKGDERGPAAELIVTTKHKRRGEV